MSQVSLLALNALCIDPFGTTVANKDYLLGFQPFFSHMTGPI